MNTGQPLLPEDDLAIRNLYSRYNHAIHLGDAEAWADCFTSEGGFSNRGTSVAGRDDLIAYASGWIGSGRSRYWIDNLLLSPTEAGASGRCYLVILRTGSASEPPTLDLTGIYSDSLVRLEGRWKFESRHIARDE